MDKKGLRGGIECEVMMVSPVLSISSDSGGPNLFLFLSFIGVYFHFSVLVFTTITISYKDTQISIVEITNFTNFYYSSHLLLIKKKLK